MRAENGKAPRINLNTYLRVVFYNVKFLALPLLCPAKNCDAFKPRKFKCLGTKFVLKFETFQLRPVILPTNKGTSTLPTNTTCVYFLYFPVYLNTKQESIDDRA